MQKATPYTYEGKNGPKTISLRMGELAGNKHPVSGIPYDLNGFPIFDAFAEVKLKEVDFKNQDLLMIEYVISCYMNRY